MAALAIKDGNGSLTNLSVTPDGSGNLQSNIVVASSVLPTGAATSASQATIIAALAALPLPTGAATAAGVAALATLLSGTLTVADIQSEGYLANLAAKLDTFCIPTIKSGGIAGNTGSITATSATPILAAPGTGLRLLITTLGFYNSSATATWVNIICNGVTLWTAFVPAGGGGPVNFAVPLVCAVNQAVTATCETTATATRVSAVGLITTT